MKEVKWLGVCNGKEEKRVMKGTLVNKLNR